VRVAIVDTGTNTTRLLVADVVDGRLVEVSRRTTITRLGEGVDRTGLLADAALDRARVVLAAYRDEAEGLGAEHRVALATSATRDAANRDVLLTELEAVYGFPPWLLSGDEEAALTFAGVASDRAVGEGTLVLDIGGGSTELTLGGPEGVTFSTSLQLGSVRATERFLAHDPPLPEEVGACARFASSLLPALGPDAAIGVAGTVTTIAALDLGLEAYEGARVHGHRIPRAAVAAWTDRLATMTTAERAALPCMEPGRAPVIAGGAIVLREVLRRYDLPGIEASERDVLHGAALSLARGWGRAEA
jgi:exopolyphosphatase/guanosine-5'-triphosphate,3'-diphosphate pyrophosphatase